MNPTKTREYFKHLCYSADHDHESEEKYGWSPSSVCRYCYREVDRKDFDVAFSYWPIQGIGPGWFAAHKNCIKSGYADEAYECQCIDSNCNDCKFLIRSSLMCSAFDKKVDPQSNFCSCMKCFVHRKSK